jgi:hypothetical protein
MDEGGGEGEHGQEPQRSTFEQRHVPRKAAWDEVMKEVADLPGDADGLRVAEVPAVTARSSPGS